MEKLTRIIKKELSCESSYGYNNPSVFTYLGARETGCILSVILSPITLKWEANAVIPCDQWLNAPHDSLCTRFCTCQDEHFGGNVTDSAALEDGVSKFYLVEGHTHSKSV